MFQIFDASSAEDRDRWLALWGAWPQREVAAHPEYARLFLRPGESAMCASLQNADGRVLLPFILRGFTGLQWAADFQDYCDWATPYGYGGPFMWDASAPDALAREFWGGLDDWARSCGAVSGLMVQSPFSEIILPQSGEVKLMVPNIVRTLELGGEELWMDYEHKVRKNVKTARRAGLWVSIDLKGERLREFLEVYYATMQRRDASDSYYFSDSFFEQITRELAGHFAFFHVLQDQRIVSTELVLVSQQNLYSFLGGTLADAFEARPNELLKHSVIEWGRQHGKMNFVLGGGHAPRDGIFRYKRSFAPAGETAAPVALRVHDLQAYQAMVAARERFERATSGQWNARPDYYPQYRA